MEQEKEQKGISKPSLIDFTVLKATKTTDFLLPLFGFTKKYYEPFLINAFIGDYDVDGFDSGRVYIAVSNLDMSTKHMRMEDGLKNLPGFVDMYDVHDGQISVYIVEIPEKFMSDYTLFLAGSYSKFSQEAQVAILKGRSEKSSMPLIFTKGEALKKYWEERSGAEIPRGAEVWPIITIEQELFYKEKFIKNT